MTQKFLSLYRSLVRSFKSGSKKPTHNNDKTTQNLTVEIFVEVNNNNNNNSNNNNNNRFLWPTLRPLSP